MTKRKLEVFLREEEEERHQASNSFSLLPDEVTSADKSCRDKTETACCSNVEMAVVAVQWDVMKDAGDFVVETFVVAWSRVRRKADSEGKNSFQRDLHHPDTPYEPWVVVDRVVVTNAAVAVASEDPHRHLGDVSAFSHLHFLPKMAKAALNSTLDCVVKNEKEAGCHRRLRKAPPVQLVHLVYHLEAAMPSKMSSPASYPSYSFRVRYYHRYHFHLSCSLKDCRHPA